MTTCTVYFALCINFLAYCTEIFAKIGQTVIMGTDNRPAPAADPSLVLKGNTHTLLLYTETKLRAHYHHHLFLRLRHTYDGTG
jgi:hypothetical protein